MSPHSRAVGNNQAGNLGSDDTFPKLLLRDSRIWPNKVAMRKKRYGIWQEYTWKDVYDKVKFWSLGMVSLGLQANDRVAILGDTNPEWFWAELAVQAASAVPVALLPDNSAEEVLYLLSQSRSMYVVVQDQEQVDKLLKIAEQLPQLRQVICWDTRGLHHYNHRLLTSIDEVIGAGREFDRTHKDHFEQLVASTSGEQTFLIQFTSGTSGRPKGVVCSFNTFMISNTMAREANPMLEGDEYVSITLPGTGTEQGFGLLASLAVGSRLNFPEEPETADSDLREIAPHVIDLPSRYWERIASTIHLKTEDTIWPKRMLCRIFMPIGYRVADRSVSGQRVDPLTRLLYAVGEVVVFRALRDRHGLVRIRIPYTAGAILAPDVLRFFRAIGLGLRQIFGSTEGGMVSAHWGSDFKYDSVGRVAIGRTVRIDNSGEMLVDAEYSFTGYDGNLAATGAVLHDGWYHHADYGHIDKHGHLVFIDRMENMRRLADGTQFSPQYIESRLRFSSYVKDAIALGGERRNFVSALVVIDFDNVSHWAERKRIAYTTLAELSQKAEVRALVRGELARVNRSLPSNGRVRKFCILPKEFDPDEDEVTRTRKLKRGFIEERYGAIVDGIYSDQQEVPTRIPVIYRDGTRSVITVNAKIDSISETAQEG